MSWFGSLFGSTPAQASNQQASGQNQGSGVRFANGTTTSNGSTAQYGVRSSAGYAEAAAASNAEKAAARASPNNQRSWRTQRPAAAYVQGLRAAGNAGTGQHPYRGGSRKRKQRKQKKSRKQRR